MPYAPSLGCLLKLNEEIQEPLTFRSNALLIVGGMCWFNFINWKKVKANLPYEKQLWRCWLEPLCLEKVLLLWEGEEHPHFTAWSIYLAQNADLLEWNDLAPRSQLRKDFLKTPQPSIFSCSDRAAWWFCGFVITQNRLFSILVAQADHSQKLFVKIKFKALGSLVSSHQTNSH